MSKAADYVTHVNNVLERVKKSTSKLPKEVFEIEGMSDQYVRMFLNNLCELPDCSYLEVGTHKGSTLVSALYDNNNVVSAYAIDNFSEFDDLGNPRQEFIANVQKFQKHLPKTSFLDEDCFGVDPNIFDPKINVYFYDGDHSAEAQAKAYTHFNAAFADTFITIIDDWAWVQNKDMQPVFQSLGYKVHHSWITTWWNGIFIAVISKPTTISIKNLMIQAPKDPYGDIK